MRAAPPFHASANSLLQPSSSRALEGSGSGSVTAIPFGRSLSNFGGLRPTTQLERSQTLRKLEALRAVAAHCQADELSAVVRAWAAAVAIRIDPSRPDTPTAVAAFGASDPAHGLARQAAAGKRTLQLLEALRAVVQGVAAGDAREAFATWRGALEPPSSAVAAHDEAVHSVRTEPTAAAERHTSACGVPGLPRLVLPPRLSLSLLAQGSQASDRAPTARMGDSARGDATPRGDGSSARIGATVPATGAIDGGGALSARGGDGSSPLQTPPLPPDADATKAPQQHPPRGGFGDAAKAYPRARSGSATDVGATSDASGGSHSVGAVAVGSSAIEDERPPAAGAELVSVAVTDLNTLMSSVQELRLQRRQLLMERRVAALGVLVAQWLSHVASQALAAWQVACSRGCAEERIERFLLDARATSDAHARAIADARHESKSLADDNARLADELSAALQEAEASSKAVRRLEASVDDMIAEQRARLKSETALQARLSEATRAEGLLQARLEESLASESRLQERLGLAQEAAQSRQRAMDSLAAAETELRAQLNDQRSSQRAGTSAMTIEFEWSSRCEALRRSLHELEGEVVASHAVSSAAQTMQRRAEHQLATAVQRAKAAERALDVAQSEEATTSAAQGTQRAISRLVSLLGALRASRCSRALAEWKRAVLAIGITESNRAEAAKMRKSALNLKKCVACTHTC